MPSFPAQTRSGQELPSRTPFQGTLALPGPSGSRQRRQRFLLHLALLRGLSKKGPLLLQPGPVHFHPHRRRCSGAGHRGRTLASNLGWGGPEE